MKFRFLLPLSVLIFSACATGPEIDQDAEMGKAVDAHESQFHACYKKFGKRAAVRVGISYRISYTGEFQFLEVNRELSDGASPELSTCILNEFKTVKLPEVMGHDGAYGTYTFRYSSE
jgi:hypothetical protein